MLGIFRCQLGMREESEHVEPVGYGHQDASAVSDALSVELHLGAVSFLKAAAEDPHHYGELLIGSLCGRPDVYLKASGLAHGDLGVYVPLLGVEGFRIFSGNRLHGDGSELIALTHAFPVLGRLGSTPAVLAAGIVCIGDALEYSDPGVGSGESLYHAVLCLCNSEHEMTSI